MGQLLQTQLRVWWSWLAAEVATVLHAYPQHHTAYPVVTPSLVVIWKTGSIVYMKTFPMHLKK